MIYLLFADAFTLNPGGYVMRLPLRFKNHFNASVIRVILRGLRNPDKYALLGIGHSAFGSLRTRPEAQRLSQELRPWLLWP